jgi:hypothetical protein
MSHDDVALPAWKLELLLDIHRTGYAQLSASTRLMEIQGLIGLNTRWARVINVAKDNRQSIPAGLTRKGAEVLKAYEKVYKRWADNTLISHYGFRL